MITAHKIVLDPNPAQENYFARACGTARFAYNWALAEWNREYKAGERPSEASLRRKLNSLKDDEFPWMREVTKNAPQQAIKNLGTAFKNYFADLKKPKRQRRFRYPQFKKKGKHDSFRADNGADKDHPNAVEVDDKRVKLPVIGWVKMRESLRFVGKIKSAVVSRTADRWFVSLTVEIEHTPPNRENQAVVGVDLGIKALATLSDDTPPVENPKALRRNLKKLKRLSRSLSRKVKGSANRRKAKCKLARLHARIANIRNDVMHKLTTDLVTRFDVIGVEDLNVRGMMANGRLARAVADVGMFEFGRQLVYKAAMTGARVVMADRWFASSKTCSDCGHVQTGLTLSDREWSCVECGVTHDRDRNAAINLTNFAASSAVTACGEMLWGRRRGCGTIVAVDQPMERPMKRDDLSRSLVAFDQASTLVAVVELGLRSWLVAGLVPSLTRQPLKKLRSDPDALLGLLLRWRDQATKAGGRIKRMVVAFEAGRDGFWLARWLRARGIEAHVIHPTSIPVSREHRRAKTDRLDTGLLMRAVLGWLRGEPKHCSMAAIPTIAEEDSRRPNREREKLVGEQTRAINRIKSTLVRFGIRAFKIKLRQASKHLEELRGPEGEPLPPNTMAELRRDLARLQIIRAQITEIERARLERLKRVPRQGTNPMIRMLTKVMGIGIETADVLVHEVLTRQLRDQRAVARYGGLTGSPDESGIKRRERGLARAGNARVRRSMIQLAWRWLMYQKTSALAQWYQARTAGAKSGLRKAMIVALARKLLIDLWRYVTIGKVPPGAVLRPAT